MKRERKRGGDNTVGEGSDVTAAMFRLKVPSLWHMTFHAGVNEFSKKHAACLNLQNFFYCNQIKHTKLSNLEKFQPDTSVGAHWEHACNVKISWRWIKVTAIFMAFSLFEVADNRKCALMMQVKKLIIKRSISLNFMLKMSGTWTKLYASVIICVDNTVTIPQNDHIIIQDLLWDFPQYILNKY